MQHFKIDISTGLQPMAGNILISEPFMMDSNFSRSVIMICEHNEKTGTFGFIINRSLNLYITDVLDVVSKEGFELHYGGPVQADTLHYLHQRPDVIKQSEKLIDNVYWGGEFNDVVKGINNGIIQPNELQFYLGYSGWEVLQLEEELKIESWIIAPAMEEMVFSNDSSDLWKNTLQKLGGDFKIVANFPENPLLN